MKIYNMNTNLSSPNRYNIKFCSDKDNKSRIIKDDDGKEYVKVPKWQNDLGNIVGVVFLILTIFEIISLISKKEWKK